jgi:tRNA A37 threonylcarbamoyladenosine dehydratase
MTREEREDAIDIIQSILNKYEEDECLVTEITIGDEDIKAFKMAIKAIEQESILDKVRDQLKSHLRGVEFTLEVLVENDPLRPKMEGVKCTLEDCLELIDKVETEEEDGNDD